MYSNDSLTSPVPLNAPSNPLYLLRSHHLLTASVLSNIQSHLSPLLPLHLSPFHFVLSLLLVFLLSYQHSPPLLSLSVSVSIFIVHPPPLSMCHSPPSACINDLLWTSTCPVSWWWFTNSVQCVPELYAQCIQAVDSCWFVLVKLIQITRKIFLLVALCRYTSHSSRSHRFRDRVKDVLSWYSYNYWLFSAGGW